MDKCIYCPSCKERGYKPVLLGKVETAFSGKIRVWCKSCKKEMTISGNGSEISVQQ